MGLQITILDGPGAGKTHEIGDDTQFVEIGRDPEHCQVLLPPEATVVGRRHLGIRRVLGGYELEVKAQNPVLIDGREPFDGEPLGTTQVVQLGRGGPRLKVETAGTGSSELPPTQYQAPMRPESARAEEQGKGLKRAFAALAAVAVVLVAGGVVFYIDGMQKTQRIKKIIEQVSRLPPPVIPADALARVRRSTYLVLWQDDSGDERPIATAWVAGDGLLATNAHVASVLDERPNGHLVVRSTVPPHDTTRIRETLIHPDYQRFSDAWDAFEPMQVGEFVGSPGAGYDVALLYAEPEPALQPPLEIAPDGVLNQLRGGEQVAFVGFPMENLATRGVNPAAPVPQSQLGHITAMTDYFLLPGDPTERNLVQHSLPAAGGASGSPMIDASGRVVAVVSGGNINMGLEGRMPSAAGVNFAQRASLVRELMAGRVDELAADRPRYWATGFGTFQDAVTTIPKRIYQDWRDGFGGEVEPVEVLRLAGRLQRLQQSELYGIEIGRSLTVPGSYLLVAVSREKHDIDMALTVDGNLVASDEEYDWYPVVFFEHDGASQATIVIYARVDTAPDFELSVWMVPSET